MQLLAARRRQEPALCRQPVGTAGCPALLRRGNLSPCPAVYGCCLGRCSSLSFFFFFLVRSLFTLLLEIAHSPSFSPANQAANGYMVAAAAITALGGICSLIVVLGVPEDKSASADEGRCADTLSLLSPRSACSSTLPRISTFTLTPFTLSFLCSQAQQSCPPRDRASSKTFSACAKANPTWYPFWRGPCVGALDRVARQLAACQPASFFPPDPPS